MSRGRRYYSGENVPAGRHTVQDDDAEEIVEEESVSLEELAGDTVEVTEVSGDRVGAEDMLEDRAVGVDGDRTAVHAREVEDEEEAEERTRRRKESFDLQYKKSKEPPKCTNLFLLDKLIEYLFDD